MVGVCGGFVYPSKLVQNDKSYVTYTISAEGLSFGSAGLDFDLNSLEYLVITCSFIICSNLTPVPRPTMEIYGFRWLLSDNHIHRKWPYKMGRFSNLSQSVPYQGNPC